MKTQGKKANIVKVVEEEQSYEIGTKLFHIYYGHGFIIGAGADDTLVNVDFHNGNVFGVSKSRIKDNTINTGR